MVFFGSRVIPKLFVLLKLFKETFDGEIALLDQFQLQLLKGRFLHFREGKGCPIKSAVIDHDVVYLGNGLVSPIDCFNQLGTCLLILLR